MAGQRRCPHAVHRARQSLGERLIESFNARLPAELLGFSGRSGLHRATTTKCRQSSMPELHGRMLGYCGRNVAGSSSRRPCLHFESI